MSIVRPLGHQRLAARNLDRYQHQNDTLCTWQDCGNDADSNFDAPICMNHAKRLAVQVMLLTKKTPVTSKPLKEKPEGRNANPAHGRHRLTDGLVYFIKFDGRIKIGFTTNLPQRMRQLPHDEILALIPGTVSTERALHSKFASLRANGEWFTAGPELRAYVDGLPKHPLLTP